MNTAPTYLTTLDLMSNRLQPDTSNFRPITLKDGYNPYYPNPDYGFDPYWVTHSHNQHQLFLYNKHTQNIEPDSPESDNALNPALANACVDPWPLKSQSTHQPITLEPANKTRRGGPQVSLATAVAVRFVISLVTRTGERDYVPLTTNLGLKYERRKLYFLMDFGELTLDILVDTGALSSAVPEADLRKIRLFYVPNFQINVANGQLKTPRAHLI